MPVVRHARRIATALRPGYGALFARARVGWFRSAGFMCEISPLKLLLILAESDGLGYRGMRLNSN